MKTSKEFFTRLQTDSDFANEVNEAIKRKKDEGAANYYETFIPVAAERGYTITVGELDAIAEEQVNELSEEELGKVAGGTSCLPASVALSIMTTASTAAISSIVSFETWKRV